MEVSIGTAQLGSDYGITNKGGIVKEDEAFRLLKAAEESLINHLDTAQGYGNAEKVVGTCMSRLGSAFRVSSKKSADNPSMSKKERRAKWNEDIMKTLKDLGIEKLDTFMLHSADELREDYGPELQDWLRAIKKEGQSNKVGVSIYKESDLEGIDLDWIDVVQIPISLYDQRLKKCGYLGKLKSCGIEIHARSIFLQGLLLETACAWPDWLGAEAIERHSRLQEYCITRDLSLQEMCIGFVRSVKEIDVAVFGLCSESQLRELVCSWEKAEFISDEDFGIWSTDNTAVIDPRKWPKK